MSVWRNPLGKVERKNLAEDGVLEYREACLNQRLIDKWYEQQRDFVKREAARLQRIDSEKS